MEDGRYVIRMDHFNEVMPNKRNGGIWRDKLGDFNSTLSLGLVRMLFKGILDMSTFWLWMRYGILIGAIFSRN